MANNPHAVALGQMGGRVSSAAKTEAARKNGKKGGRPKGKKPTMKSISALACLIVLLSAPVSAQTKAENIFNVGASAFDTFTTVRFLTNGSGCWETNPILGRYPSTAKVMTKGALDALSTYAIQRVLSTVHKKSGNRVVRALTKHGSLGFGLWAGGSQIHGGVTGIRKCGIREQSAPRYE